MSSSRFSPPQDSLKERLDRFIHHPVVDAAIMVLIVGSVVMTVFEVTLDRSSAALHWIRVADWAVIGIFAVELSIRFYIARKKAKFFKKYWLDILALFPVVRSLRFLRLVRLLRVFRVGLLLNRRISNSTASLTSAAGEYLIIAVIIILTVLFGAIGLRVTEGANNPDFGTLEQTAWWSVMSMIAGEPIGAEPHSTLGKVLTLVVVLSGMTAFAIFTGTVSAVMVNRLRSLNLRIMDLDDLRGHTVICGWNRSGNKLVGELSKDTDIARRGLVIVAEFGEDEPDLHGAGIDPERVFIVRGDYTRVEVLKECGVNYADVAVLLADRTKDRTDQDRDARTVLAAVAIERMNPNIFTSVELTNRENGSHLKFMGVEEIVIAEEYTGSIIAMTTKMRGMMSILDELLTVNVGNEFHKVVAPAAWVGKEVREIENILRETHHATLIALEQIAKGEDERRVRVNPPRSLKVGDGDSLVVIAEKAPALQPIK